MTTPVICGDCAAPMDLVDAPADDGRPLGVPANRETRALRARAHEVFDQLWQEKILPDRASAYTWLRGTLGLTEDEGHIGRFDKALCLSTIDVVNAFMDRWEPNASPIIDRRDPWGIGPPSGDVDDLDEMRAPGARAEPDPDAPAYEIPSGW